MRVILCIPMLNAAKRLPPLLEAVELQTLQPSEFWVIDSSSTDETLELLGRSGVSCHIIPKETFNHGGTRNLFLSLTAGDIYIFLTDDAIPANPDTFKNIINVFIQNPKVGLAYGRQIPHSYATPFASHLRLFNYPETSLCKTMEDSSKWGIKTPFCSNSFAAYRASALKEVGGFPLDVIVGEDVYVAAKMLKAGWAVHYEAEAVVYHSHNYTVLEEFKRYFDIGVFYKRENWIQKTFGKTGDEGKRYLISEFSYLKSYGAGRLYFQWFIRNAMKWLGYRLGTLEKFLPLFMKKSLSMHSRYWGKKKQVSTLSTIDKTQRCL